MSNVFLFASAKEPLHPRNQVRLRCLHHQMKMIGHEHVGVDFPPGLGATLSPDRILDSRPYGPVPSLATSTLQATASMIFWAQSINA